MSERILESFLHVASTSLSDNVLVVSLHPWNFASQRPAGALFPTGKGEQLDADEVQRSISIQGKETIILGCTSFDEEEEAAARLILRQLSSFSNVCILLIHLISEGEFQRDSMDAIMQRHERMIATGVHDVLMNPNLDAQILRQAIAQAYSSWELKRPQYTQDESPAMSIEQLEELSRQHHELLWESIPKLLMPHVCSERSDLVVNDSCVGEYQIVRNVRAMGTVQEVLNRSGQKLVMRSIDKLKIVNPGQLEGIYREFRFLSDLLQHPGIVKCVDFLHTYFFVYMVFEHAGHRNLAQHLQSLPSQHLEADPAWDCFSQLAEGVRYCHSKHVSHRAISLEHLVLSEVGTGGYHYKLIDFQMAMVAQPGVTSNTISGDFPCMAPEMAAGTVYIPWCADFWSTGIVLLETAGGLESTVALLRDGVVLDTRSAFEEVRTFFQWSGSHLRAVCNLGANPSPAIVRALECLLQPDPEARRLPDPEAGRLSIISAEAGS